MERKVKRTKVSNACAGESCCGGYRALAETQNSVSGEEEPL